jgi:hypothetical protein
MNTKYQSLIIFLSYFLIIGLFYIELPLNGSLPGNHDTWANLAMFKELLVKFEAVFSNEFNGQYLYPADNTWVAYGLDFFSGIIWVFFFKLGLNEVWAYWAYITTILSLNSIALYEFSSLYLKKFISKYSLGLIFSLHFFIYLNIDNPNVLSYFPFFLAILFFLKYCKSKLNSHLIYFSFFTILQIYLAPVVFILLSYVLVIITIFKIRANLNFFKIFFSIGFILIFIAPFLWVYFFLDLGVNGISFATNHELSLYQKYLTINIFDFLRLYPNHLLYPDISEINNNFVWLKHLFPGFFVFILFITGLRIKRNKLFIFIFIFIFLFGNGEFLIHLESFKVNNPFYNLFLLNDGINIFRIPSRVNVLLLFCFLMIAFITLESLFERGKINKWIFYIFIILLFVESSLWYKNKFESAKILNSEIKMNNYIKNKYASHSILLNLPSGLFDKKSDIREFKYMVNRYSQSVNILNGSVAFYPKSRINMWKILDSNDLNNEIFCKFLKKQNVSIVLLYTKWQYTEVEKRQINIALQSNCLKVDTTINDVVLLVRDN